MDELYASVVALVVGRPELSDRAIARQCWDFAASEDDDEFAMEEVSHVSAFGALRGIESEVARRNECLVELVKTVRSYMS